AALAVIVALLLVTTDPPKPAITFAAPDAPRLPAKKSLPPAAVSRSQPITDVIGAPPPRPTPPPLAPGQAPRVLIAGDSSAVGMRDGRGAGPMGERLRETEGLGPRAVRVRRVAGRARQVHVRGPHHGLQVLARLLGRGPRGRPSAYRRRDGERVGRHRPPAARRPEVAPPRRSEVRRVVAARDRGRHRPAVVTGCDGGMGPQPVHPTRSRPSGWPVAGGGPPADGPPERHHPGGRGDAEGP